MKENSNEISDQERLLLDQMVKEFEKSEIPLKIRKIKLLEMIGLPISKIDFLDKKNLVDLKKIIDEKLKQQDCPLMIRFACVPDKFSMPFFYIEKGMKKDENKIIENINFLVKSDQSIKNLILQEATPVEEAKDKISGRISFEKGEMMPIREIVEIYKGARSTGILNNVDVEDPDFLRLIKAAGEFIKPAEELHKDSSIKKEETVEIYNFLNLYREKMEIIIELIARSQKKSVDNMTISLEFSYRNGRLVFSDIDF